MNIRQCLCQVFAETVFMSFPGINREKGYVFQVYGSFGSKENTKYGFWLGNAGLQDDLILFPFFGVNRKILRGKCLMLAHGLGIYQFDA